jgi:opacity protein-like surface antigen
MGRSTALILAVMMAVGASGALAADLPARAPIDPPPPPPPIFLGGWYVRGDVGVGLNQIEDFRSHLLPVNSLGGVVPPVGLVSQSLEDSPLIGGGIGYQFMNWFRVDLTGEYRGGVNYHVVETYSLGCQQPFCLDSYNAHIKTALFMANAYFDLGTWRGITPYVGGGIGVAFHRFGSLTDIGLGQGFAPDTTQDNFTWAVMAGVAYNIMPNFKVDLGYRYIDMGRITSGAIACTQIAACFFERQSYRAVAHDIRIGFRYYFADPLLPSPVVASY